MLTRRQFARGLALAATGLLVPAPLIAAAAGPTRRLWALDGSMLTPGGPPVLLTAHDMREAARFAESAETVVALIEQAVRGFSDLMTRDPWTAARLIAEAQHTASPRPAYARTYRRRLAA